MPRLPWLSGSSSRNFLPAFVVLRRTRVHGRPPGLHHDPPVRLLSVAHLHHVDRDVEPEELARQGHGRTPLARAGLGGDALDPRLFIVIGLRDGRVRLVAAGRAHAFVFVIDLRGRAQGLFEPVGPEHRRRPPERVDVEDLLRDIDPARRAHFLFDERHGKDGLEVVRSDGLLRARVERRLGQVRHVRHDVVPLGRYFLVRKNDLRLSHYFLRQSRIECG